jgi:ABC exporter DevB family membrane fusion protein
MFAIQQNLIRSRKVPEAVVASYLLSLGCCLLACSRPEPQSKPITTVPAKAVAAVPAATRPVRVIAQGQIMPAQGIIKLYTAPSDVVNKLSVKVGSKVAAGDLLAEMRSWATVQSQRATLVEQKKTASQERDSAIQQAELKLMAAQLKAEQVVAQQQSLLKQSKLIEVAQQQVASSEEILQRLNSIASDRLTREFVGRLEIERQRLTVDEAKIKLAQQQNSRDQAQLELELARKTADAEIHAAQRLLELAKQSDPVAVVDAQLQALDTEQERSQLKAPSDGVVLAIHASEGGSVVQTPLIEMANLDVIVCELEVNVGQARYVQVGQKVVLRSESLQRPLTGVVQEKSALVGKPKLRSVDPLAAVDYRTLSVIVKLDEPDQARDWIQLQVDAEIDTNSSIGG